VTPSAEVLVGLVIAIGLIGILLPAVPGALLVLAAILVWASEVATSTSWLIFAVATASIAVSQVVKFTVPGRRMVDAGVPRSSLVAGALAGIVGFFVIPVAGLVIGFVVAVYAAERHRLGSRPAAWSSTRTAVRAVGLSLLIELGGALVAATAWLLGVLFVV
jgi:uncharacterized protein